MESKRKSIRSITALANVLAQSQLVGRYDLDDHVEADAIANAIADMEAEFQTLTEVVFPKLSASSLSEKDINEILWEVRDRLRHVVYHINDCRTFRDILSE